MKNLGRIIITVVFSIILISCESTSKKNKGQKNAVKVIVEKVNLYLNELEKIGFSGTLLVDYKGEKIISKGYGKSDIKNNISNHPKTIMDIGSITKQFTAAGILKLEMLGELTVDDALSKYFPTIPSDKSNITVHQLLTHSSGLVDVVGDDYEGMSEEEFLDRVFQTALLSPIGEKYNYSNVGYSLLAIIIERVSNVPYEQFLNEKLFTPAEMHQTGYTLPNWKSQEIAVGYSKNSEWGKPNEKKWDQSAPFLNLKGNGGILSSVEDLYKWHLALLGEKILSNKAKDKYYKPYIKEGENSNSFYAYGWAIFPTSRGTKLITHNGGNGIFFADFWRYLEEQVTVIVLTNNSNSYNEIIASQIAAIILKDNYSPIMPEDSKNPSISEESIQDQLKHVFTTIRDGDKNSWSELIKSKFTIDFIHIAPMETHLSFFEKFSKRLKGGEIASIEHQEDEIVMSIKTKNEQFNMVLNMEFDENDELKFAGIMID